MPTEYHVISADKETSFGLIGTTVVSPAPHPFDNYSAAAELWKQLGKKKRAVNLLAVWACGCVRHAIVKHATQQSPARYVNGKLVLGRKRTLTLHQGWRRIEACAFHAIKPEERDAPEHTAAREAYRRHCGGRSHQEELDVQETSTQGVD